MAQIQRFSNWGRDVTNDVSRFIKKYDAGQISIQFITTVVPDQTSKTGSKLLYKAYVTYPG